MDNPRAFIKRVKYKKWALFLFCITLLLIVLLLSSCATQEEQAPLEAEPDIDFTEGKEVLVTSIEDSGDGTLRWALEEANPGYVIRFDTSVFPPHDQATIYLSQELPPIHQGNLTVDASNAGVILDGSNIQTSGDIWTYGINITSDKNIIQGLQITNFSPAAGIIINAGAKHNTIGGDRDIGTGPLGQGNLISNVETGIAIQDESTSYNTITGNLLGIKQVGNDELGEKDSRVFVGVHVLEGARYNTIGPYNIIAHSDYAGIILEGKEVFGNTITQNMMHNNKIQDISLQYGANDGIKTPSILYFDMEKGEVEGTAPPLAKVEVYSLCAEEIIHYEGTATANNNGQFIFSKETSLTGEYPAALVTGRDGNSSEMLIMSWLPPEFQIDSPNQPGIIETKTSAELVDNKIGGHWHGLWAIDDLDMLIDQIISLGLTSYRFAINSIIIDFIDWSKSEWTIVPEHEAFIDTLVENDITLTYVLTFWDKDFVNAGGEPGIPRFQCEDEIQRYLDFVQNMVRLLGDRVEYYEIWNEAMALVGTLEHVEVEDYIELVKRAAPVIWEENPKAKIVISGTCYLIMDHNHEFLNTVINSELMEIGDVIAFHPMYGTSPEDDFQRDYYYNYSDIIQGYREKAAAAGFTGRFVADELTWRTPLTEMPELDWIHAYEEIVACKYNLRGILMNLGIDVAVTQQYIDPMTEKAIINGIRNLCTVMDLHETVDIPVEIEIDFDPIAYYTFSYPNGKKMLAIWTDGVAQSEDPGIPATITFPGLKAQTVTGIDVLHGFEQELIYEIDEENTIIRDFLVKDYPILIYVEPIFDSSL